MIRTYLKDNKATIILNTEVTEILSDEIVSFVEGLEYMDDITELIVEINSPGGSVLAGYSIYNSIKKSTKNTTSIITGVAASIASVIMLSTDSLLAYPHSLVMIHNAFGGNDKALDAINKSILSILKNKFGDKTKKLMAEETWFTSNQLIDLGIVDKLIDSPKEILNTELVNSFDLFEISNKILYMDSNLENTEEEVVNQISETEVVEETVELVEETVELVEETVEVEENIEPEEIVNQATELEIALETIKRLEIELNDLKNSKKLEIELKEKNDFLNSLNIEIKNKENILKYDIATIKDLYSNINVVNKIEIIKNTSNEITVTDFLNMTNEERTELFNNNKDLYMKLFKKTNK